MNKKKLIWYSLFLFFLFGSRTVSYSQNNFKRNYIGIQAGTIVSKGRGPGVSVSEPDKKSFVLGEQIGITYKYFSKSRFMFGCDVILSRTGRKDKGGYGNATGPLSPASYGKIEVTNKTIFHCIDLPQYLGYSPVKSHNFCISVFAGWMPRIVLSETAYRTFSMPSFNNNESIIIDQQIAADALIGASLDFKLSEKLALELCPKYSYGLSKELHLHNIYIPVSLIMSLK